MEFLKRTNFSGQPNRNTHTHFVCVESNVDFFGSFFSVHNIVVVADFFLFRLLRGMIFFLLLIQTFF